MATVKINGSAVRAFQTSPSGPIANRAIREANALRTAVLSSEHMAVDEGRLRNSTTAFAQAIPGGHGVRGVVRVGANYAAAVHNGTRPHFPPVSALAGWVRRHGMAPGAAFAIARRIAQDGTRARPFLTDPLRARHPTARIFAHLRR